MCVCVSRCLTTVFTAALVLVAQPPASDAAAIDHASLSPGQLPTDNVATETSTDNEKLLKGNKAPNSDGRTSAEDRTPEIPRISAVLSPESLTPPTDEAKKALQGSGGTDKLNTNPEGSVGINKLHSTSDGITEASDPKISQKNVAEDAKKGNLEPTSDHVHEVPRISLSETTDKGTESMSPPKSISPELSTNERKVITSGDKISESVGEKAASAPKSSGSAVEVNTSPLAGTIQIQRTSKLQETTAELHEAPSSLIQSSHTHKNEISISERTVGEQSSDQPLTTVITPVYAVEPERTNTVSTQQVAEIPSANDNPKINIAPVSETRPKSIVNGDSPGDATVNNKPNSYTITPNEFAKKTAIAHAQMSEEEGKEKQESKSGDLPEVHSELKISEDITTHKQDLGKVGVTGGVKDSLNTFDESPTKNTGDIKSQENDHEIETKKIEHTISQDLEKDKLLKKSRVSDNIRSLSLLDLTKKLFSEIKSYISDLDHQWDEKKERMLWLGEAADELHNYKEKITETEGYNNKCTKHDWDKYKQRVAFLKEVIDKCEASLKRKTWHELEEKTQEVIKKVSEIIEEFNTNTNKIPKEDPHFNDKKLVIENNAKRKLEELNIDSIKITLSELKAKSFQENEDEYKKCVNEDETEKRGLQVISETRTDVTGIYNCVG